MLEICYLPDYKRYAADFGNIIIYFPRITLILERISFHVDTILNSIHNSKYIDQIYFYRENFLLDISAKYTIEIHRDFVPCSEWQLVA